MERSVLFLLATVTLLTAFAVVWHHRRQRVTAITLQLNLQRLDFDLQRLAERRARAARRAKLASRAATLHDKLTVLEPHASLHPPPPPDAGAFTTWHALAPDGGCPAPIPAWDWRTFLRAALGEALQVEVEALQVELERDRRRALAAVVPDDGEGRQERDGREQKQNAALHRSRLTFLRASHSGEFIIVNLVLRRGATRANPNQ